MVQLETISELSHAPAHWALFTAQSAEVFTQTLVPDTFMQPKPAGQSAPVAHVPVQ